MYSTICNLLKIQFPIVQAGMVWCSGWKLASAVSNSGGLGLIGAGSMYPDTLLHHIRKCKTSTTNPFGVNIPLLYPDIDKHIDIVCSEKVKVVFTSAGNPKTWTKILQAEGITVVHVVSSTKFALKAADAGVDAIVAEGFEAGGHNGRDETTTFCLIPAVKKEISLPLIAAGGIGTGEGILAAFALGADGVQIGSRFAASLESSAHPDFKKKVVEAQEGDTILTMKSLTPVRLIKNKFYEQVKHAEERGANAGELKDILQKGRAKKGIFEGDMEEGELEIGQISALIKDIKPAAEIVRQLWDEYLQAKERVCKE